MHRRVAIIAYSLRFPGTDTRHFWNDLLDKKDLVTEVDPARWAKENFLHPDKRHPGSSYTFAAGTLGDISGFDAAFFGISPREAVLIDPQQRLMLELAWEAFENAGIRPSSLRGSDCGVYIGISNVDYAYRLADDMAAIEAAAATGIISSIAANRISYAFDLHGPSISMDTACSSSLVAFHQAYMAIKSGDISQALAGGINLHLHPYGFISFAKASMLSKTGRCHVFDESGDGYVRSEGGGLFLLKNYDQALADGDPILAIVAGSGVNTDGHKSGLTIPNSHAQTELISRTYQQAGISPEAVDYFEAHGTGTAVGDPIEAHSIGLALGQKRQKPLLVGSVKSNLGHLESASGVAGLVKALNCIQHRAVPATINIKTLNPKIKFAGLNLHVVTDTQALKTEGDLVVGINSFGFGGANAHVILQSPPKQAKHKQDIARPAPLPLVLSGKEPSALKQAALDMAGFLDSATDIPFYDAAYSAFFHRERHAHAVLAFVDNAADTAKLLRQFGNADRTEKLEGVYTGSALANAKGPAFVYSGNGCQWLGMGRQLLAESETFRRTIAEIDSLLGQYADFSLLADLSDNGNDDRYDYTEIAQPALFAVQVGITEILREHGINPVAVLGHSVGEVAAAWAAGALSLPQAVQVIYYRSYHQGKTKGLGGMTAVGLNADEATALMEKCGLSQLALAGINSYRGVTIAGDVQQLAIMEAELAAGNSFFKRLPLDYAFHSPAMDSIKAGVTGDLSALKPSRPKLPFFSTVTGSQVFDDSLNGEYWWDNIRRPVQFRQAVDALLETSVNVLVEIGAHPVLHSYLNDCLKTADSTGLVLNSVAKSGADKGQLTRCAAQILMSGVAFGHTRWFPSVGKFTNLPNYPWQREKLWHPVTAESYGLLTRKKIHPLLGYPLQQQHLHWENQLDTQLQPYLADHNVGGAVVFPGAGFAELAATAAYQSHPSDFIEIEDLEIRSPLVLGHDQTKVIRFGFDGSDARFSLRSRELAHSSEWQAHCVGRVLGEATGNGLAATAPALPDRKADFDRASHAALTQSVGLEYGTAFQTIDYGWVDGNLALGVLSVPEAINEGLGWYFLHPSLLDNAFQLVFQILKDQLQHHEGIAFVPVKIGRLHLCSNKSLPVLAEARLLHQSPHSIKAGFRLFDADGVAVAVLNDVRFRAVRLHRQQTQHLSYLDYHLTAAPLAKTTALKLDHGLFSLLGGNAKNAADGRYSSEVEPLLDSLCQQIFMEFLETRSDGDGFVPVSCMAGLLAAQGVGADVLAAVLAAAADGQMVTAIDGEGWQLHKDDSDSGISKTVIWNMLVQEYPDYFFLTHLLGRVGLHWDGLLDGSLLAADLGIVPALYAKINSHILEQTGKQALTAALQAQCQAFIENLAGGERLRILEISAYKPEFASLLCPQLDFRLADYCFASFCGDALNNIANLREQFPLLETLHLPAAGMAMPPMAPANFAIINLNQGNVQEIRHLLNLLPELLLPGSPLLLLGLYPARWLDSILGFAENWWIKTESGTLVSPQLSAEAISEQLQSQGFGEIQLHELQPGLASGHYLLTTSLPENGLHQPAIATKNWLILADSDGTESHFANAIAGQLRLKNQQVSIKSSPEATNHFAHIIHLSGFGSPHAEQQAKRCLLASAGIQLLENTQGNPQLWLLTQGVATLWPCDQATDFSAHGDAMPHDAALWGYGRTLLNEANNYQMKLLDINGNADDEDLLAAVVDELLYGDHEQEVVFGTAGQRFVPRLRCQSSIMGEGRAEASQHAHNLHLGFKLPGQLRNLYWQSHVRTAPADDEIEVEVKATGLNFRDVMYTLGLLSDEAVENGFVGATLGLEFAGVIIRIGSTVTGFNPGDCVMGLGPASFSNRVLTKANTITLIPNHISFAAAATIPSTFFTVYYALHHQARLQPGEKILIHGAAGGVGIAAIQIARWLGAEIYATVGSEDKRDFLELLGIGHVFDSRSLRFAEDILAKTAQRGVDVVLNSLAGEAINRNFHVLKPFGRFLELGKRDFYENTAIGLRPFRNNISYFGIDADQLMQERPALTRQLFTEMMQLFHDGILFPLPYTTFDANQVVDAFRYMQQARQIGKIVVTYQHGIHAKIASPVMPEPAALRLTGDASYLVTGGLGGFGLKTAQWLVEKGARHLILISRSGAASEAAQAALAAWAKQGVNVYAAACDVSDKSALASVLAHCAGAMPAVKGVVHAAAVIDDGLVRNADEGQIQRVLRPKIQGALALHELSLSWPLDFFILYSSVTTLFGNPGQSNYVAANLWLEALAAYRNRLGLVATCVRWGAIDDVGFLARNEKIKAALQNRMGGAALSSDHALAVLETILQSGNRQTLGVMEFDWRAVNNSLPTARTAKFRELAARTPNSDQNDDHRTDIKRLLDELPDDELQTAFVGILKEELSRILLVSKDKVNPDHSMYDMGLDSLMGVELMVAIEARFDVQVPVMALSEAPTLNKLASRLLMQLRGESDVQQTAIVANINDLSKRHDSAVTDAQLSDLAKELESGGGSKIIGN